MPTSIANTLGIGSGIDTAQLISDLASASRAPKEAQIKSRESANTAQISAFANLASAIDSFASSLNTLITGGSLFTQPTTSDASVLGVSTVAGSRLSTVSAQVEAVSLATAQSLVSSGVGSAADPIGQGSFTLSAGGQTATITIGAANDNLAGLAAAINGAKLGVTATVITDGGQARLIMRGQAGEANAFTLTADAGAPSGFAAFTWDGTAGGMSQAQAAADAHIRLDGVDIYRGGNSFDDVIPGIKFDLKKAAIGQPITIGAERQTSALSDAVNDFVTAYNTLETALDEMTAPGLDGGDAGALRGNTAIREARRMLAGISSSVLRSGDGPRTLSEIGVRTNRDGSLAVDADKLSKALADDPASVEALFNPGQTSSNPLVRITSAMGKTKPGTYTLTNLVPANGSIAASGTIAGVAGLGDGNILTANATSTAAGLQLEVLGNVTSATVTIDPGLGGALQAIRDALRAATGPLATANERLEKETKAIAKDREAMEARDEAYTARLTAIFTAMESRMAAIKATQSYLEQQIAIWNKSDD